MRRFSPVPCLNSVVRTLVATAILTVATSPVSAQVIVGPNVNMGGGPASFTPPSTIIGDPFLQRQNEPSIAVSSRNPCHLLAGANDYRAVDFEEAAGEVGDAWLGVFKSFDCGATWTSTLLPGHKLDTSAQGLASPLKGLAAGADPTVRAGTSGLFYYSGIAFNRGDSSAGKVFVARFIDNNNKDGGDPIQYLGTTQIDLGTSGQFLDKPWIVADVPRGGSTCNINGRTVPAGPVYLVYTSFVGGDNNVRSKIMFSKSTNCGATWSNPSKLSEGVAKNQGTTIAVDPGTGDLHLAWREFASPDDANSRNAILVARSTDGGQSFTKAAAITPNGYQFQPFDQASSPLTFRTNAYPTIAVVPAEAEGRAAGQPGRVYVAWSARGFGGTAPSNARVVVSTSIGGASWTDPRVTDSYLGAGHQIMPALAFAGSKMALAYYDLRNDASGGFDDLVFEYGQQVFNQCRLSPGAAGPLGFAAVVNCIVSSPDRLSRRHTLDMRAAVADALCLAAGTCDLTSASVLGGSRKVSRYIEGRGTVNGARQQLQYNRPNLPIFSKGRLPFIGDYIDIAGQSFVATADGGWAWNTGRTTNRPAPVFHVAWADNRNVGTPRNRNWELFTPAVLGPGLVQCVPGQVGIRNQDVYTAQLRPGLIVSAPQNSKRISGLQRSFVVVARNTTDSEHDYLLQAMPPPGVIASFDQFGGFGALEAGGTPIPPVTQIVVRIPRRSSISRTVFVGLENPPADPSAAPDVLVAVKVDELAEGAGAPTGTFDSVFLNPDFENPDFENPDFENAELHNPDFENLNLKNPDFENPDFENFTLSASSSIRNPDFENPDFENPDFENPDFENPDFENVNFLNPDFENPDFENPDFENPDFENPDFENPDFENGSFQVSDTTWPLRNNGNTTSAYKTNVFVNNPPQGVKYQLAVRRIFTSPAAVCAAPVTPNLAPLSSQSVPVVNIVGPNVQANPFDRNFNDPSRENATFSLAPGERGIITLRAYCDERVPGCTRDLVASLQGRTALGVVAQGANCTRCTGAGCTGGDLVGGFTECSLADGPPKDIYDPIPPTVAVVNPTITTPETIVAATDGDNSGFEPVSFTINATDNVAVAVNGVSCLSGATVVSLQSVSADRYVFSGVFPVGITGVSCTAIDVRANPGPNAASVSFLVNVRDVTPPVFNTVNAGAPFTPGNPAEATGPNGAQVFYTNPAATDSISGLVTVTCLPASGSIFPIAATTVTCTAADGAGNPAAPATFAVTVRDTTAPVIAAAGNLTAEATSAAGVIVTYTAPVWSDAVSGSGSAGCLPVSGSTFPIAATTVSCTAADGAGNASSPVTFTVTVRDTTAPVLGPVTNRTAEATSATGAAVTYGTPSATDAVGASVSCAPASGSTFAIGTSTVTCTATDAALNSSTKTFTVTVSDTLAPVVTATANPITLLWSPNKTMTPVTISGRITDANLKSASYQVVDEYGTIKPTGAITVAANGSYSFVVMLEAWRQGADSNGRLYTITVTAVDINNRSASAQAIVTVPHNQ